MVCNKCHCNHKCFKNGKQRKMCPKKGQVRRIKGQGSVTDKIKSMAIAYAKKRVRQYAVKKGWIKNKPKNNRNLSSNTRGASKTFRKAGSDVGSINRNVRKRRK